ncbi:hypothetical protein FACS1894163_08900 [Spirochaetia bacterium]|nr:hypothetical protein FACS1894163_08900 [Spirochaetia bacterium]
METAASSAKHILTLNYKETLKGHASGKLLNKKSLVLYLTLRDQNGAGDQNIDQSVIDQKDYLLIPDKYVSLPKPKIGVHVEVEGKGIDGGAMAKIKFSADVFARYVYAEIDGIDAPLSDNFFDIPGKGSYEVSVPVGEGTAGSDIERRIHVRTLADVDAKRGLAADSIRRFLMRFNRTNLITWFLFKFFM